MEFKRNIIVTGGAGFIGSHVVRLFVNKYPEYHIINLDKLTYAGNLANLKDIEDKENYTFVKADICDYETVKALMAKYNVDGIIHLAAESHVDRSIKDPFTFAHTNVIGTLTLLQAAKEYWESLPEGYEGKRFYHISTDEVYGALELTNPEGIEYHLNRSYRDDCWWYYRCYSWDFTSLSRYQRGYRNHHDELYRSLFRKCHYSWSLF